MVPKGPTAVNSEATKKKKRGSNLSIPSTTDDGGLRHCRSVLSLVEGVECRPTLFYSIEPKAYAEAEKQTNTCANLSQDLGAQTQAI